jgi:hypothetical protein
MPFYETVFIPSGDISEKKTGYRCLCKTKDEIPTLELRESMSRRVIMVQRGETSDTLMIS